MKRAPANVIPGAPPLADGYFYRVMPPRSLVPGVRVRVRQRRRWLGGSRFVSEAYLPNGWPKHRLADVILLAAQYAYAKAASLDHEVEALRALDQRVGDYRGQM